MARRDDILERLRRAFAAESAERLSNLQAGLRALATGAATDAVVATMYRDAHSLKGAARAADRRDIEELAHALESVFDAMKSVAGAADPACAAALQTVVDGLAQLLPGPDESLQHALRGRLAPLADGASAPGAEAPTPAPAPVQTSPPAALHETVRVPAARLAALLARTDQLVAARLAAAQRVRDLDELQSVLAAWGAEMSRHRPQGGANADVAADKADFAARADTFVRGFEGRITRCHSAAERTRRALEATVDGLVRDLQEILMVPLAACTEQLQVVARQLARDQGKYVEVQVFGDDLEIDRRVIDRVSDGLRHIVRNAIDHGIEDPAGRERLGKPRTATLQIRAARPASNRVELAISDDGAGIDTMRLRDEAVRRGMLDAAAAAALDERQSAALVFLPGLSTRTAVSAVSGRGLGMAIVREQLQMLGGHIDVDTSAGGTTFHLELPVTLASFRGVLVEEQGRSYVLPTAAVERVVRVASGELGSLEGRPTLRLGERTVPVLRLSEALGLPAGRPRDAGRRTLTAAVLGRGGEAAAFAVDRVIREQPVIIRDLGERLPHLRNVFGATVLPTGDLVPVLDGFDLLAAARHGVRTAPAPVAPEPEPATVLVVDDSITSRTLLRSILESAGYRVQTAVDGEAALTALRGTRFDAVVSDIEMPRLDGFGLTAAIRAHDRLAGLPVLLVTSLDSRADRERGLAAGANAYIVKSRFDDRNLIAELERHL